MADSRSPSLAESLEAARRVNPTQLRALPLRVACAELGVSVDAQGQALCPFHEADGRLHNPSFHVYRASDRERWICHPCGRGGDVIDLVRAIRGMAFAEACGWLADLLDQVPPAALVSFRPEGLSSLSTGWGDPEREWWEGELAAAQSAPAPPASLAAIAGFAIDGDEVDLDEGLAWDEYLHSCGWCMRDGVAWIPHRDERGSLTGIKTRRPVLVGDELEAVRKGALPGSTFPALYGAWRGRMHREVLLTEGETDCVWAARQIDERSLQFDCFGLPRGAASNVRAEWLNFLRDAVVYTAFDPDPAGERATERWREALGSAGISCRACSFEAAGVDLRVAAPDLVRMIAQAR